METALVVIVGLIGIILSFGFAVSLILLALSGKNFLKAKAEERSLLNIKLRREAEKEEALLLQEQKERREQKLKEMELKIKEAMQKKSI